METIYLSDNDLNLLNACIVELENNDDDFIILNRNNVTILAGLLNTSREQIKKSIKNLQLAGLLTNNNSTNYYYLNKTKSKELHNLFCAILNLKKLIFSKIEFFFHEISKKALQPVSLSTQYSINNLDQAFFCLNRDMETIKENLDKLKKLNSLCFELFSIQSFFIEPKTVEYKLSNIHKQLMEVK